MDLTAGQSYNSSKGVVNTATSIGGTSRRPKSAISRAVRFLPGATRPRSQAESAWLRGSVASDVPGLLLRCRPRPV